MVGLPFTIVCLAYILGVLFAGNWAPWLGQWALLVLAVGWLTVGMIFGVLPQWLSRWVSRWVPQSWRSPLSPRVWLIAALVGWLAAVYVQVRTPMPSVQDVSQLVPLGQAIEVDRFQMEGTIATTPKLTRSQRFQWELAVRQATGLSADGRVLLEPRQVNGTLYVTLDPIALGKPDPGKPDPGKPDPGKPDPGKSDPGKSDPGKLQIQALYPGRSIRLTGSLYQPQTARNPGAFDFQQYLKRQGIFAGFRAETLSLVESDRSQPGLMWQIQQHMIQAFVRGLGDKAGLLVSAMVMGNGSVNIPHDIAEQFRQVGLSHALAASGFQVSLLLQVVFAVTQRLRPIARFALGLFSLSFYIGLTGLEASVLRAAVMGGAVLLGQLFDRRVKVGNALLGAAVLLLLFDPLLLWDLGFQLSFLATCGLLVTVPPLVKGMDGLPMAIASGLAVPIAAYVWTLPLQLYTFGVVSPYSIPINLLTSLLITLLSLGGMASALVSLPIADWGSWCASWLHLPSLGLLKIAAWASQLPGASHAVGTIALWQVIGLYGLYGLIWLMWQTRWRKYWSFLGVLCLAVVILPIWYAANHVLRVSVLDTVGDAVFVIQDRGRIGLIHSGNEKDVEFVVLPFLRQQGINQIDWAIAPELRPTDLSAWSKILTSLPIGTLYNAPASDQAPASAPSANRSSRAVLAEKVAWARQYASFLSLVKQTKVQPIQLVNQQTLKLGAMTVQFHDALILQMRVGKLDWMLLRRFRSKHQQAVLERLFKQRSLDRVDVLCWLGGKLSPQVLETLKPKVAIFKQDLSRESMKPAQDWLAHHAVTTYEMNQAGAIQWTPNAGFTTPVSVE